MTTMFRHLFRRPLHHLGALVLLLLAFGLLTSCSRIEQTGDTARVAEAFSSWKNAVVNHQPDIAMAYLPGHLDNYIRALNATPMDVPASSSIPGVDHLLRVALDKKVSPDLRANLTLDRLIRRLSDHRLICTREVSRLDLGRVSVSGDTAGAEVYYQRTLTALRLPFLKENGRWKIDVMSILPYAEILLRVDRAIKGETEAQQVDHLVSTLPSL